MGSEPCRVAIFYKGVLYPRAGDTDDKKAMGHGKLRKFEENKSFDCLLQPAASEVLGSGGGLVLNDHPIKGHWNASMFSSPRPIVLELGCGKGEYTIDLACRRPEFNYVGVDIKGARLWKGAKYAHEHGLSNVAFLRTRIEFIEAFFAPGEVAEIWLTFSDPQLKKENCRLTSPMFLERYRTFLALGGIVHLKTDSMFLHNYTLELARQNGLEILAHTDDLYGGEAPVRPEVLQVQTFYEKMFLARGLPISYMAFRIDHAGAYVSPVWDCDYWRSIEEARGKIPRR